MLYSELQNVAYRLVAAASSEPEEANGPSTYLFVVKGSSLCLQKWNNKGYTDIATIVNAGVRPNSSVAHIHIPSSDTDNVLYIDTSSRLHVICCDNELDERFTDITSTHQDVHSSGNIAACLDERNRIAIFFQNNRGSISTYVDYTSNTFSNIPVRVLTGSPLWAKSIQSALHVFYVSAMDSCMHYASKKFDTLNWLDHKMSDQPFHGTPKNFIVFPKQQNFIAFEICVLMVDGGLLHLEVDGTWTRAGKVDANGTFTSERRVDILCEIAHNDRLTERVLGQLLAEDPSIIDAVGGPLSLTPLAAACLSGSLEAVTILLDNPYRLADPNAVSPQNRTPLYYAVCRAPAINRKALVSALLDAGADVDASYPEDGYNTPLMNAIADTGDKGVVHELVDRGASLTKKNLRGQTAVSLASGTSLEQELRPRKERTQVQKFNGVHSVEKEAIDALVAIAILILAICNNEFLRDLVRRVLTRLEEMKILVKQEQPAQRDTSLKDESRLSSPVDTYRSSQPLQWYAEQASEIASGISQGVYDDLSAQGGSSKWWKRRSIFKGTQSKR